MVILGMAYYLLSSHWRTLIHLLAIELTVKQTHHLSHKGPSTHGSFLDHLNHNTFHSPLKFTILIDSPNGNLPQILKKNLREPNMFDASKWQGSPCYLGFFPFYPHVPIMSPHCYLHPHGIPSGVIKLGGKITPIYIDFPMEFPRETSINHHPLVFHGFP